MTDGSTWGVCRHSVRSVPVCLAFAHSYVSPVPLPTLAFFPTSGLASPGSSV